MDNDLERVNDKGQSSDTPPVRPSIDIRVLVVDDDTTTLAIVSSILQIFNYKVETAKNPLDALATLRMQNGYFDLVVTDLHMPYMNGFELQKQVDKEFKLPVIMMSADDKENVMFQSAQSGIVLFIQKPVNPEEIKDVWQFALRTNKGKSIMNEEIRSDPNPPPPPPPPPAPIIDLAGDDGSNDDHDDDHDDDENQGDQSLSGTGRPLMVAETEALIPGNRLGKRDSRSPPKDGNKKGSKSAKMSCGRPAGALGRSRKPRRPKIVWTNSLHNRFLLAIKHLSFDKSVPKKILEFMNVPGLTRENVASHLQKYRLFLKKVSKDGIAGARMMADRILLRSSFAGGYPMQIMMQNVEQLYPHPSKPNQPLMLPPAPQSQSQIQPQTSLAPNNNNNVPSSSTFTSRSTGISTLLTNNQPAATNVVRPPMLAAVQPAAANVVQPPMLAAANINGTTGGGPNSHAIANNGGGVNPMQAWQQQNEVRVRPFAGTTYPSNNNFGGTSSAQTFLNSNFAVGTNVGSAGNGSNYLPPNNSAGVMIKGGLMNMAGYNKSAADGGALNRINGGGGCLGMVNGTGLNGNMNGMLQMGQVGGGSSSGGLLGANNPLHVQAPTLQVVLNMTHQQQNANAAVPPPPPQHGSANLGRGNSNNSGGKELGGAVDNNVPILDENGLLLNVDNLPSPNYQALIEDIPSDFSDISLEDEHDQVNPPTNQVLNPDPSVGGPSRVQELRGTGQALLSPGGNLFPSASEDYFPRFEIPNQQKHTEDLIYPYQIMNYENLHHEVDWDEFMDAMLQDDFGPK